MHAPGCQTNALAGARTINLSARTSKLNIAETDEDEAAAGNLDIGDGLTTNGADANSTMVDGGQTDRVFHLPSAEAITAVISDLTIQNGLAFLGGGSISGKLGELKANVRKEVVSRSWWKLGGAGSEMAWWVGSGGEVKVGG